MLFLSSSSIFVSSEEFIIFLLSLKLIFFPLTIYFSLVVSLVRPILLKCFLFLSYSASSVFQLHFFYYQLMKYFP